MVNPNRPGIDWLGPRRRFTAVIQGAQAAPLAVPITRTQTATYATSGATDPGDDVSRFFTSFIVQPTTADTKDVTVQVSLDGATWVSCPTELLAPAASATIAAGTGGVLFVTLPCPGIQVRLLVAQPVGSTDFVVHVSMSDTHAKYDPKRS